MWSPKFQLFRQNTRVRTSMCIFAKVRHVAIRRYKGRGRSKHLSVVWIAHNVMPWWHLRRSYTTLISQQDTAKQKEQGSRASRCVSWPQHLFIWSGRLVEPTSRRLMQLAELISTSIAHWWPSASSILRRTLFMLVSMAYHPCGPGRWRTIGTK